MSGKPDWPKVPKFASRSEEARWWDEPKEMIEDNVIEAMGAGTAEHGAAQRLAR
jgi:hypothetical protein